LSPDELQQLLLATFADEAKGQLETINWRLHAFEAAVGDQRRALLDEIFRELHNLKGAARSADLVRVEAMVHDIEDVLGAVREGLLGEASVSKLTENALGGLAELIWEATAGLPLEGPRHRAPSRMLPPSAMFEGLSLMAGQLARALSKEVLVTIDGHDFEVDRHVLDQLHAPLTHMVRNCVDHGVEDPDTRLLAGKERVGSIVLAAWRPSADLVVEVADDGAGIDVAQVKAAAVRKGLVSPGHADRMSEHEALRLIFHPGVSTRRKVTMLSGRGVGLDVVREHIESLGGTVDVSSAPGRGSTFTLRVPLEAAR